MNETKNTIDSCIHWVFNFITCILLINLSIYLFINLRIYLFIYIYIYIYIISKSLIWHFLVDKMSNLDLPSRGLPVIITEASVWMVLCIISISGNSLVCIAACRNPKLRCFVVVAFLYSLPTDCPSHKLDQNRI